MSNSHRANVLVTSCLKTPVDPHTKAPLASYERERVLPYSATVQPDNRDCEEELEHEDSGSDVCDDDYLGQISPPVMTGYRKDRLDFSDIFFSNEEYYTKLEELKTAHLHTMAELENMYRQKLQLKSTEPLNTASLERGHRLLWSSSSPAASNHMRKSHSAIELRRGSCQSTSSNEQEAACKDVEKGLLFSPKEYIKNMWQDFQLPPHTRQVLSSSLHSLPGDPKRRRAKNNHCDVEVEPWKHRLTIPKPFQMTLRETEKKRRGVKTRSEVELENAELRRQLEELTECQRKFRASPAPAHVHLPPYRELQERQRRVNLRTVPKPFSFLERERLKKEKKELRQPLPSDQEKGKPFKAKPVPKSVYAAASGEQMKEEQLYRSIKIQMRAQELLHSAAMPPSMLARRLSERKKTTEGGTGSGDDGFSHQPQINREVPNFDASYRRFQKHLEKHKEVKRTTTCEPFELRTSQISSHRERILADIEKEQSSPRALRWPFISPGPSLTPNSSLCSSLSGSLELLPTKVTGATKKRHEAVRLFSLSRKALEQRRKAEEEEEHWKEQQRQRERKLQRVVSQRAQANDPHLALSQTHQSKLREFRRQELQRRKEYQQEIREMQKRVMGRPLLLEQVTQKNARQAADRRYVNVLQGCGLTEEYVSSKAAMSTSAGKASASSSSRHSNQDDADMGYESVHYRKVFLDDEDDEADPNKTDETVAEALLNRHDEDDGSDGGENGHLSDQSYSYSDDHESYSGDSDRDSKTGQQAAVSYTW